MLKVEVVAEVFPIHSAYIDEQSRHSRRRVYYTYTYVFRVYIADVLLLDEYNNWAVGSARLNNTLYAIYYCNIKYNMIF